MRYSQTNKPMYLVTWMAGLVVTEVKKLFPDEADYQINCWTEVHEGTGSRAGLLHTHCLVQRDRAEDRTTAGMRMNGVLPDIKKRKNSAHAAQLVRYWDKQKDGNMMCPHPDGGEQEKLIQISADDTSKDRQWFIDNLHLLSEQEMVGYVLRWNMSLSAVSTLRRMRLTPHWVPTYTPIAWHPQAAEYLGGLLPRQILWIWSQEGNTGKSHFSVYLEAHLPAGSTMSCFNAGADYMYLYSKRPTTHCFFDLPRAVGIKELEHVAHTIERLCDGIVSTSKYEGANFRCKPPVIVVTSNTIMPANLLSRDRVLAYEVTRDAIRASNN